MRLYYLFIIPTLLLTGCLGLDIAASTMMAAGGGRSCSPLSVNSMVPTVPVVSEDHPKLILSPVVEVEHDKVKTIPFAFSPPGDCWLVTGIDARIFEEALWETLMSTGFVHKDDVVQPSDFVINAQILEQTEDEDFHGLGSFTRKALLVIRYSLKRPGTDEVVWNKEITTEQGVRWGAFVDNSPKESAVSGIVFEMAIRANLEALVHDLNAMF